MSGQSGNVFSKRDRDRTCHKLLIYHGQLKTLRLWPETQAQRKKYHHLLGFCWVLFRKCLRIRDANSRFRSERCLYHTLSKYQKSYSFKHLVHLAIILVGNTCFRSASFCALSVELSAQMPSSALICDLRASRFVRCLSSRRLKKLVNKCLRLDVIWTPKFGIFGSEKSIHFATQRCQ